MSDILIGVDAGTSMIKSVAFSTAGEPLYRSSRNNEVLTPRTGWREQDLSDTWDTMAATLRAVMEELDEEDEVLGVGVTAQGDGCWLVDDEGQPARDAILWSDARAEGIIDQWQQNEVNERLYDICGCTQFPGSSLAILLWLQEHEPEVIKRAETVFFCKDWLKYKLTNTIASDPSDMTLPYLDIETIEYDHEVFDIVGTPELGRLLPPLQDPLEVIGEVTNGAAEQTNLPEGTSVVSGLFDVPASMFGSGVSEPGEGSSVVGTTSLNQMLMDEPAASPHGVGFTLALGLENRWSRFMSSMIGTPNLDWTLEKFRYRENPDYEAIEKRAGEIPIGSEGVLYHPYLSSSGERAPFLNTRARAQFTGLDPDHTEEHLIRAVYEGVALAMKDCYEHIPNTPGEVYVAGGGANSAFWCQMFADCIGAEFSVPEGQEFGAKGAALLVATAIGLYDDLGTAVAETRTVETTYSPDLMSSRQYDELYDLYKTTYEAMFDIWNRREKTLAVINSLQET